MPRCPKGTHRIPAKIGKCVKTEKIKPKQNSKITDHFSITSSTKNKIKLLGNIYHQNNDGILFQVSFSNKEQFTQYVGLSKTPPRVDCFYQTAFSLGLRSLNKLKKDVDKANFKAKEGVIPEDAAKFIACSFGLTDKNVELKKRGFAHSNETNRDTINDKMETELVNNHATIICLGFVEKDEEGKDVKKSKHYIVAYKYNDKVFYFDPQRQIEDKNVLNIIYEPQTGHQVFIEELITFLVKNVTEHKLLLKKKNCKIPYYG